MRDKSSSFLKSVSSRSEGFDSTCMEFSGLWMANKAGICLSMYDRKRAFQLMKTFWEREAVRINMCSVGENEEKMMVLPTSSSQVEKYCSDPDRPVCSEVSAVS